MGRKRKPRTDSTPESDAGAKRRQRSALYRKRPEVLERQRILMANRRANIKERRRQWDPPEPSTPTPEPVEVETASQTSESDAASQTPDPGNSAAVLGLTLAELTALDALTELAGRCGTRDQTADWTDTSHFCEDTASLASSLLAVQETPIDPPEFPQGIFIQRTRRGPLPRYITQETVFQKKMRRELGKVGPLTPIQVAQITAHKLRYRRRALDRVEEFDREIADATTLGVLSIRRWHRIRSWQEELGDFEEWDIAERDAFEVERLKRDLLDNLPQEDESHGSELYL
ncbi:hypothetical protein R3P38DRAFT_3271264 [Favolaschia claudopus]|uniref:Uncharacterized protein n=1 Tax=Favolaschia claudopus TaxID=2862362 RepID=A0AAW0B8V0_9AGAR